MQALRKPGPKRGYWSPLPVNLSVIPILRTSSHFLIVPSIAINMSSHHRRRIPLCMKQKQQHKGVQEPLSGYVIWTCQNLKQPSRGLGVLWKWYCSYSDIIQSSTCLLPQRQEQFAKYWNRIRFYIYRSLPSPLFWHSHSLIVFSRPLLSYVVNLRLSKQFPNACHMGAMKEDFNPKYFTDRI